MFFVTLALMIGTAGLPHVIVRFYTVPNVRAARWSAFWALLFIAMLYLTAPATAAFARYFMIESLNGRTEATLPDWFAQLGTDRADAVVRRRRRARTVLGRR